MAMSDILLPFTNYTSCSSLVFPTLPSRKSRALKAQRDIFCAPVFSTHACSPWTRFSDRTRCCLRHSLLLSKLYTSMSLWSQDEHERSHNYINVCAWQNEERANIWSLWITCQSSQNTNPKLFLSEISSVRNFSCHTDRKAWRKWRRFGQP